MGKPESKEFERIKSVAAFRLRELRIAKGWSQEELADLSGCHRTYIGMLERRQGNPSLRVLAVIAEALGVPTAELFVGQSRTPITGR